jgi:hypothetical protein
VEIRQRLRAAGEWWRSGGCHDGGELDELLFWSNSFSFFYFSFLNYKNGYFFKECLLTKKIATIFYTKYNKRNLRKK